MDDPDLLKYNKYFKLAFGLIKNHPYKSDVNSLHAAVIVKGGRILSSGINKPKQNGFVVYYGHSPQCTIHAEMESVLSARKKIDLNGAKIYIARLRKKDMKPANSMPCLSCQKVLLNYGIKRAYFTTELGYGMIRATELKQ